MGSNSLTLDTAQVSLCLCLLVSNLMHLLLQLPLVGLQGMPFIDKPLVALL
jgi:hypothetical protein